VSRPRPGVRPYLAHFVIQKEKEIAAACGSYGMGPTVGLCSTQSSHVFFAAAALFFPKIQDDVSQLQPSDLIERRQ
jgi:hypothetical protein